MTGGHWGGCRYLRRELGGYVLWRNIGTQNFFISTELGDVMGALWWSADEYIYPYEDLGGTGIAIVCTPSNPGLEITGNPTPDCTNWMHPWGTFGGKPYYEDSFTPYYTFWATTLNKWVIALALSDPPPPDRWDKSDPIEGGYAFQGTYTGSPSVTLYAP